MSNGSITLQQTLPAQQSLLQVLFVGGRLFYGWVGFLSVLFFAGIFGFIYQTSEGLVVSNMREHISWGYYISNFAFLVGVAAAAVLLVIPAYLYHFKAIKK